MAMKGEDVPCEDRAGQYMSWAISVSVTIQLYEPGFDYLEK
jgi:hypothetical protein